MRPEIEKIDGFLDNERFASQSVPGRVLSLSTWRDEKAVIRWRTLAVHHRVQEKGRFEVFRDYHLRVGEFTADSRPPAGQVLPQQRLDETEVGAAKYVTITELSPRDGKPAAADLAGSLGLPAAGAEGLLDRDSYESIYVAGKLLLLASWRDCDGGGGLAAACGGAGGIAASRGPGGARLWHVRSARGAAILSGGSALSAGRR